MDKLRVIYGRSDRLAGWLIRSFDTTAANRWSHCGAIVDTDKSSFIVEARAGLGVVSSGIDDFVARYSDVAIVCYDVPSAERGNEWVLKQLGKPYDYLAVLGALFRASWQEDDSWQCAELVEMRNVMAGRARFNSAPSRITPNLSFMVI